MVTVRVSQNVPFTGQKLSFNRGFCSKLTQEGPLIVVGALQNVEQSLFGQNFGARDPYAGELTTDFGDKPLGNMDTEHIIKPPDAMKEYLGLLSRHCSDIQLVKLEEKDKERLRNQVPGWKLKNDNGLEVIEQEWKCRDFKSVIQLVYRFGSVAEFETHFPLSININNDNSVTFQLSSKEVGGLSERDFVLAAKINGLEVDDLLPPKKQRFWA
eukprot:TRINITY_DN62623_c0_g1_i1.p1 TRINITY_DN62623_c0_g1~~TRINITY_DN62623_c0_g1_i1.p1  ORF type:complete len:213 (-),score=28.74 TRINITY_DN62623_c0_g1_i1:189-827(-)